LSRLEGESSSHESEDGGQGTSDSLGASTTTTTSLDVGAHQGTVGKGSVGVGSGAVGSGHHSLGLLLGNVAEPVVRGIGGQNIGVDSADDILEHSIVHGDSASEPVTTVVGVDETVLAEDGLVLDELVGRCGGEVVGLEEGGETITDKGLIDDDVHVLERIRKGSSGREDAGGSSVEEGGTGIGGEGSLVGGTGESPGRGHVVEFRGFHVR